MVKPVSTKMQFKTDVKVPKVRIISFSSLQCQNVLKFSLSLSYCRLESCWLDLEETMEGKNESIWYGLWRVYYFGMKINCALSIF